MFNNIVIWVGSIIIIISFILSIHISIKKDKPLYLKYFFFIPLIALLITINTITDKYFHIVDKEVFYIIQMLITFFDLLVWIHFFLQINNNKSDAILIKTIFFVIYLLTSAMFITNEFSKPNFQIICIFNIGKSILCIHYYYKLFQKPPIDNLNKNPAFWIINGLFFYSCISIPFFSFQNFFMNQLSEMLSLDFIIFSNILIIIMHLFFLKAFSCSIKVHRV